MIIQFYLAIYLLYKFNPYIKHKKITEEDKNIIFNAGFFLLTVTALDLYVFQSLQSRLTKLTLMESNEKNNEEIMKK